MAAPPVTKGLKVLLGVLALFLFYQRCHHLHNQLVLSLPALCLRIYFVVTEQPVHMQTQMTAVRTTNVAEQSRSPALAGRQSR